MINDLVKDLLGELGKIAASDSVTGKVRDAGQAKVMPLCKVTIGFGTGGADVGGKRDEKTAGVEGGAAAGGLTVEPRAFVVVGPDGVPHLVSINKGKAAVLRKGVDLVQVASAPAPTPKKELPPKR